MSHSTAARTLWTSMICITASLNTIRTKAQEPDLDAPHHPSRLLIRFAPRVTDAVRGQTHAALGGVERQRFRFVDGLTLVDVPPERLERALRDYQLDPNILYAEPDYAIDERCDQSLNESEFTDSLVVATSRWGDVSGSFDSGAGIWKAPDGTVDFFSDVLAVQAKFSNDTNAPMKGRCDIDPDLPNRVVDVTNVSRVLNAFQGFSYPFGGPIPCP